jgi:hypothetical protein
MIRPIDRPGRHKVGAHCLTTSPAQHERVRKPSELANKYWRRVRRLGLSSCAATTLVVCIPLAFVDGLLAIVMLVMVWVTYVAYVEVPRWGGGAVAQDFLAAEPDGINYGNRKRVPWTSIRAITWRKFPLRRRREAVFSWEDWRPSGLGRGFGRTYALPISLFDPNWLDSDFMSAVHTYAPHVVVELDPDG